MKTNRILSYFTIKGVLHQRSNPGTTYDIFELFYLRDTWTHMNKETWRIIICTQSHTIARWQIIVAKLAHPGNERETFFITNPA